MSSKGWKRVSSNAFSISTFTKELPNSQRVANWIDRSREDEDYGSPITYILKGKWSWDYSTTGGIHLDKELSKKGFTFIYESNIRAEKVVSKYFDKKLQALKFAKAYMKKH